VISRASIAKYSAPLSTVADNDKIEVQTLYGPLIQQALGGGLANGSLWP